MKSILSIYWHVSLICTLSCSGYSDDSGKYLQQTPPAAVPEIFAPNLISREGKSEFGSVFSADGTEFFYAVDRDGKAEIRYTRLENDGWSTPSTLITHDLYSHNDPFLSPAEDELYYISNRPLKDGEGKKDYDIWYSIRENTGWSAPIHAGPEINSEGNEYYVSFTEDGTLYFHPTVGQKQAGNMIMIFMHLPANRVFSSNQSG